MDTIAIEKIKRYIEKNDIHQAALARKIGVKEDALCRWLHGSRIPTRNIQERINKYFEIHNDWYDKKE